MNIPKTFICKIPKSVTFIFACLPSLAFGSQLTVNIGSFADPTDFGLEGGPFNLRVGQPYLDASPNLSTHVLLESLVPIESGSDVYTSPYRGVDLATGTTQDEGLLYMQLPTGASLPEGVVASPIVGVLQRSGPWSDYNLTAPETTLGGASGSGSFDSGVIELVLIRGEEAFTGSTTYVVDNENQITLAPFTVVVDGVTSIDLSETILIREGERFIGTVSNLNADAAYDSLLFSIELTEIPDLDLDGIPDLVDDAVDAGGLVIGEWQRLDFSWVFGLTAEWGASDYMGYVYVQALPYVYALNVGWLYAVSSNETQHFFYSSQYGWITVSELDSGFFYYFVDEENQGWLNFLEAPVG